MYPVTLWGRRVRQQPDAAGAIGASYNYGGTSLKSPAPVAGIVAKVAAGPTPLSPAEKDHLAMIGIKLRDVTGDVKEAKAKELSKKNLGADWINLELQNVPTTYAAAEPITSMVWYGPAY